MTAGAEEAVNDFWSNHTPRYGETDVDDQMLAAFYCVKRGCFEWFINLCLPQRIEVIFVVRAVLEGLLDKRTAEQLIKSLISQEEAVQLSLRLGFELLEADVNMMLPQLMRFPVRQWTEEEDFILFASVVHKEFRKFSMASRRSSFAVKDVLLPFKMVSKSPQSQNQ